MIVCMDGLAFGSENIVLFNISIYCFIKSYFSTSICNFFNNIINKIDIEYTSHVNNDFFNSSIISFLFVFVVINGCIKLCNVFSNSGIFLFSLKNSVDKKFFTMTSSDKSELLKRCDIINISIGHTE